MFAVPIFSWVVYTIVQQGKQIIILEQKVNESLNERLKRVESRVAAIEEKIDEIGENVAKCQMLANDTQHLNQQINSKFDNMINRIEEIYRQR